MTTFARQPVLAPLGATYLPKAGGGGYLGTSPTAATLHLAQQPWQAVAGLALASLAGVAPTMEPAGGVGEEGGKDGPGRVTPHLRALQQ